MLTILFTYHQVMASFLDFVFPFGKQLYAKDFHFGGFKEGSRFSPGPYTGISELNRSGLGLRLSYNLRSVERSQYQTGLPWSIRQIAVYHEFDIQTDRGMWIIVKGDKFIRDRMTEVNPMPILSHENSRSEAFSLSLSTHLLLCDWCGENWR